MNSVDRQLDVVVIGAGVVGLAIARALARAGREVVVLEAASAIGTHTSSRNSEVIHAGLYYPTGSLKAELCVAGRRALYAYCAEADVAHRRIGKLLVATTEAEIADPHLLQGAGGAQRRRRSDLGERRRGGRAGAGRRLRARPCLSPSTGIIDSHGLMRAFERDARRAGAEVVLESPIAGGAVTEQGIALRGGGRLPVAVVARTVVNAAGLFAPSMVAPIDRRFPRPRRSRPTHYAKGHYFVLSGPSPFRRLDLPGRRSPAGWGST